jgi:hypothetical protein
MAYVNGDPVNNIDIDGLYASNTFDGKPLGDGGGRLPGAPEEEKPKPKAPTMDFATWGAFQFARLEAAQNQSQLNNSPNVKYASKIAGPNEARQSFPDKHGNYHQLARGNASSDYTIESLVIPLFKPVGWAFNSFKAKFFAPSLTNILQMHVTKAAQIVDGKGMSALTEKQIAAVVRNPKLFPMFRGNRIDVMARELIRKDSRVNFLQSNYSKGPDFFNTSYSHWWDMTTPAQWDIHVRKYGTNGTLLKTK